MRERTSGILEDVIIEHPLHDVRIVTSDVLIHIGIAPEVVEPWVGAVVYTEHDVPLVAGPHVFVVAERKVGTLPGPRAFEQDVQVLAVHLSKRLEAEGAEYRWGYVVGRGVVVAGLSCYLALRMP